MDQYYLVIRWLIWIMSSNSYSMSQLNVIDLSDLEFSLQQHQLSDKHLVRASGYITYGYRKRSAANDSQVNYDSSQRMVVQDGEDGILIPHSNNSENMSTPSPILWSTTMIYNLSVVYPFKRHIPPCELRVHVQLIATVQQLPQWMNLGLVEQVCILLTNVSCHQVQVRIC